MRSRGGEPSFPLVNFDGTMCISVNNEIVHGIPGKRVLREGDIVSLDLGVIYKGWHGDAAMTVPVGTISAEAQRLLDVTARALALAIAQVRPGGHLYDIGGAVEDYVNAERMGLVRQYVGHGIGREHARGATSAELSPGTRADAARCCGPAWFWLSSRWSTWRRDDTVALDDGWTVVTKDGSLSAHFEHSVAVTAQGYEILSRPSDPSRMWGDPAIMDSWNAQSLEKLG